MTKLLADGRSQGTQGRLTAQRGAVLEALSATGQFRTAQGIYAAMRAQGVCIGLTTVYRHLQRLADEGVIHSVQTIDRQTAYRLCSDSNHHHLVCIGCGAGTEITDTEFDRWVRHEAASRGYSKVTHTVDIFGLCPECSAAPHED